MVSAIYMESLTSRVRNLTQQTTFREANTHSGIANILLESSSLTQCVDITSDLKC